MSFFGRLFGKGRGQGAGAGQGAGQGRGMGRGAGQGPMGNPPTPPNPVPPKPMPESVPFPEQGAVGQGQGLNRQPGGSGEGPAGECVCPVCGTKAPHQTGVPCYEQKCPKCGATMTRAQA